MNEGMAEQPPSAPGDRRATYAATLCAVIVAGLLCRWPALSLPPVVAKYAGAVLWGAMVYVVVSLVSPASPVAARLAVSAVVAAAAEFSQLIHWPWLDAFRQTTMGALLLGRTFAWWDIVAYWVGIAGIGAIDAKVIMPGQRE